MAPPTQRTRGGLLLAALAALTLPPISLALLRPQLPLPAPRPPARHLHRGCLDVSVTVAQARRGTEGEGPTGTDRLCAVSGKSTAGNAAATTAASNAAAAVLVAALSMGVGPTVASALPPMNCNR